MSFPVEVTKRKPGRPRADEARPSVKESLIGATIKAVASHGPLAVNARRVCTQST